MSMHDDGYGSEATAQYGDGGACLLTDLADQAADVFPADDPPPDDLAYRAWTIIANVGHRQGGWDAQDPEWVEAAIRWRDEFHDSLHAAERAQAEAVPLPPGYGHP